MRIRGKQCRGECQGGCGKTLEGVGGIQLSAYKGNGFICVNCLEGAIERVNDMVEAEVVVLGIGDKVLFESQYVDEPFTIELEVVAELKTIVKFEYGGELVSMKKVRDCDASDGIRLDIPSVWNGRESSYTYLKYVEKLDLRRG